MEDRKFYSLAPGQKLTYYAEKFSVHKQLMNIATSCLVETKLDLDILKKAAAEAVQRNDVFGIRLTKQGKDILQYFTDREVLTLESIDFSGKTQKYMEDFFYKTAAAKMKIFDSPQCKIYVLRTPEGKGGLFICVSHFIMDSWAISMFYKDIFDVYFARKDNTPMPKPIPSYELLLQKEIDYQISEKHDKDIAFWKQELSVSKPMFTHVNGRVMLEKWRRFKRDPDYRYGRSLYFRTTAKHVVCMVQKEDVDAIRTFCTENHIPSSQAVFFMGVRTGIAKFNEREKDVTILMVEARRATLEEKFAGGTRALAFPLRTVIDEDTTFLDAVNMIIDKQNIMFRHADLDTMEFFALQSKIINLPAIETYTPLHFTFQPVPMTLHDGVTASTNWYCNGAAASNLGISVMDGDGTGSLRCYYEYHDRVIKPETLNSLHDYMMRVIKAGIFNPTIKLKDLLDLPVE